ncbi:N-acetylmuramoyl-L-alanine amidase [Tsukamurella sp. NPDC003166]|uniref:N-acetylmuramoyl-L-alanine amidase n=1 Tax=Tsukamurella sp. NPDC003166 TaxID=3154444 RepID=UPI0033A97865
MSDPTWLPDVLRAAGLRCDIYPGAMDRGHGDFGGIWGVVCHHTGSNNAGPGGIAQHPDLGLASQLHLSRDGVFTLCGVGIAWHAGQGSYPGIQTNNANVVTIGIEAANDGGGTPGRPHRSSWPDAQYQAYVTGVAAILNKLGQPASHAIGHKEWAGAAQGKWDPGAIDMNTFRADVAREQTRLKGGTMPAPNTPLDAQTAAGLALDQLAGPGTARGADFPGWPQLGGRTVVEALGAIGEKLGIPGFKGA